MRFEALFSVFERFLAFFSFWNTFLRILHFSGGVCGWGTSPTFPLTRPRFPLTRPGFPPTCRASVWPGFAGFGPKPRKQQFLACYGSEPTKTPALALKSIVLAAFVCVCAITDFATA